MQAHDLRSALAALPKLTITEGMREEDAAAAMQILDSFNGCMIGLVRFSGETPWERHPDDELLHVLEGDVDVTVLADREPTHLMLRAGSVCVVPKQRWHRQSAPAGATLLFVTSEEGNDTSAAADPRT